MKPPTGFKQGRGGPASSRFPVQQAPQPEMPKKPAKQPPPLKRPMVAAERPGGRG